MPITTPMCDTHECDLAKALCIKHKRLMCFGCALKEAAFKDCEVKEIQTLDEKQSLLLRCLLLRQSSSRKEYLMTEHEKKTDELKKDLEQKVVETYEKFNNRLKQLRDDCLESLDKQAYDIRQSNEGSKQSLLSFQESTDEIIDKLTMESMGGVTEIERTLNEMETDILNTLQDEQSSVEKIFEENTKLVEALMSTGATLSKVALIVQSHYAVLNDNNPVIPENTTESDDESNVNEDPKPDDGKGGQSVAVVENQIDRKEIRKGKGLFSRLLASGKNKSDEKERKKSKTKGKIYKREVTSSEADNLEETYALSTFSVSNITEPKHLINKTVHVSELKKQEFLSALKFSKLLNLGDGYIGMASEIHKSIVIVGFYGKLFGQKKFTSGKTIVCGIGKCAIATVKDPGIQIVKFKVSDEGLTTAGSVVASEQLSNITGFDFDVSSSKFAVSTPEKVIILDKNGKYVKDFTYNSTNNQDTLATAFHFEKQCLYILNIGNKTLKMLSVEKTKENWKRKIDDSDFTPKCMCLYEDKLCISCGSSIAIFSTASGEALVRHETSDLMEDCLGMCVIDSVLVFSSGSDDFETSSKLAYISI